MTPLLRDAARDLAAELARLLRPSVTAAVDLLAWPCLTTVAGVVWRRPTSPYTEPDVVA